MSMKVDLVFGSHYDSVLVNGKKLDPAPSQKVWNHSPDGFAWGYGGSGPSQLALALLLHHGLNEEEAVKHHQAFKFDTVAAWPQASAVVYVDIDRWLLAQQLHESLRTYDKAHVGLREALQQFKRSCSRISEQAAA